MVRWAAHYEDKPGTFAAVRVAGLRGLRFEPRPSLLGLVDTARVRLPAPRSGCRCSMPGVFRSLIIGKLWAFSTFEAASPTQVQDSAAETPRTTGGLIPN